MAVGAAVVLLALLRILVVETFTVTSDSMRPTLEHGDRLMVLKTTGIRSGDIVVFDGTHLLGAAGSPASGAGAALVRLLGADPATAYVKRVIGVPGDRITCCTDDGRLTRNGVTLDEPYTVGPSDGVTFDVTVPADRYWVLGDNREDSADSRSALGRPGGGMLRADDVIDEVVWRYWPRQHWGGMSAHPALRVDPSRSGDGDAVRMMGNTAAGSASQRGLAAASSHLGTAGTTTTALKESAS